MAHLGAGAFKKPVRVRQPVTLIKAEVDPRFVGLNISITVYHLPGTYAKGCRPVAKTHHLANVRIDLEDDVPQGLGDCSEGLFRNSEQILERSDINWGQVVVTLVLDYPIPIYSLSSVLVNRIPQTLLFSFCELNVESLPGTPVRTRHQRPKCHAEPNSADVTTRPSTNLNT